MQPYKAILPLQLKGLKLSTFQTNWENHALLAEQEGWCYGKYLSQLCEIELQKRQASRLLRRTKESSLPTGKTLSSFDFKANNSIKTAQIHALAQSDTWLK